jgi:hypothetical protein
VGGQVLSGEKVQEVFYKNAGAQVILEQREYMEIEK